MRCCPSNAARTAAPHLRRTSVQLACAVPMLPGPHAPTPSAPLDLSRPASAALAAVGWRSGMVWAPGLTLASHLLQLVRHGPRLFVQNSFFQVAKKRPGLPYTTTMAAYKTEVGSKNTNLLRLGCFVYAERLTKAPCLAMMTEARRYRHNL